MVTSNGGCADAMPSRVGRSRTALAAGCAGEGAPPEGDVNGGVCQVHGYRSLSLRVSRRRVGRPPCEPRACVGELTVGRGGQ